MRTESEIQNQIVEHLREDGWVVTVFSLPHRVYKGIRGWFDVVAIKNDHALLLEIKAEGKREAVRPSQRKLHENISCHTGEHIILAVVDSLDQVKEITNAT